MQTKYLQKVKERRKKKLKRKNEKRVFVNNGGEIYLIMGNPWKKEVVGGEAVEKTRLEEVWQS